MCLPVSSRARRPAYRVGLLLCALVGGAACNASIGKFDVTPRNAVCPGTPVTIVWSVTGSPKLTLSPKVPNSPDGKVDTSGKVTVTPNGPTTVSLRVSRCLGEPTGADIQVTPPKPEEIAASLEQTSSCTDGVLTLTTETKNFDPKAKAIAVSSPKRDIEISRADSPGTPTVIPKGGTTGSFSALPANGAWSVSTTLLPGESCSAPPKSVTFYLYTACEGVAP